MTTRRFDDIAPDREKGCLNFLYVLVAPIKLDQPEIGDVRDRAIDYRGDCHGKQSRVMVEPP